MDASLRAVLSESERLLIDETDRTALAALDEDAAIELEARIRRARGKYVSQYRRSASARVAERGGRGKARPENANARAKAEAFERALAQVSRPIPIPPAAEEVAFTPDSKIVYFASSEGPGRGTTPVNITTGTAGKTVHIGAAAQIAMTPDGKTLYATNTQGVIPVDVATDTAGPLIPSAHGIIQEIGISP